MKLYKIFYDGKYCSYVNIYTSYVYNNIHIHSFLKDEFPRISFILKNRYKEPIYTIYREEERPD